MKKLVSLLKASMTSGMNIFKIKTKNKKQNIIIPLIITGYLMFMVWGSANAFYEKLVSLHIQYVLLPIYVVSISMMTFVEGIYKTGSLIFNCKDDNLLFSLPIQKRTILLIRILKFYLFELAFNSIFMLPAMVAYIRWAETLSWTYFLSSIIMLLLLPIIPIILSCFVGAFISSISSKFKRKNIAQTIITILLIIVILCISYKSENVANYILKNATSINDLIIKIYYPAGVYAKLISDFHITDLLVFIIINILLMIGSIYTLSIFYFKMNTNIKKVVTSKKGKKQEITIKANSQTIALIKKELNTFLQTPVFIINSGFALVLYILIVAIICIRFDSFMPILTSKEEGLGLSKIIIMNNIPVLIFGIISVTAYMTSITNSVISLEGKSLNIIKSLPVKEKKILISKIFACMIITSPILIIGNIALFIRFKIQLIDIFLLGILSILIPLVSHFIGILVNLKFPKLDFENETEVVKQSVSSFVSVIIGMILAVTTVMILVKIIDKIQPTMILLVATGFYLIVDAVLYAYLTMKGTKEFRQLSI